MRRKKKKVVDIFDGAKILGIHPESLREMVREERVETIDPDICQTGPYYFNREYLESLPKPKRGRPRKTENREEVTK